MSYGLQSRPEMLVNGAVCIGALPCEKGSPAGRGQAALQQRRCAALLLPPRRQPQSPAWTNSRHLASATAANICLYACQPYQASISNGVVKTVANQATQYVSDGFAQDDNDDRSVPHI